jgi:predicted RNase H-like HicB family nuclease
MHQETNIAAQSRADWPDSIKISIWLVYEDDQWSALASEFDVVGMGATQEAALENLRETLSAYLQSFASEGAPFEAARRPIPLRERFRLRLSQFATVAVRRMPDGSQDRPRSVEHAEQSFTPSEFAHC